MKVNIHTGYNKAFQWIILGNIRFIGYLTNKEELTPNESELTTLFGSCKSFSDFTSTVSKLNGVFSIIYEKDKEVYAASDPTRFFPLFYCLEDGELILSDDVDYVRAGSKSKELDKLAVTEYLSAAFTCGDRTIFSKVKQLTSSEAICFSEGKAEKKSLFSMAQKPVPEDKTNADELISEANKQIDLAFERILVPLKDKAVLLPLSGGVDSRLIACKLKELGFRNVLCFTYGKPGPEVDISRRVAKTLGYEWHFIEYTDELLKNLHRKEPFDEYFRYASRGTSMFYLQEFPAMKWLIEQKIINEEYIVLPGHPGDLLRGSLILSKQDDAKAFRKLPDKLISKKFIHYHHSSQEKAQLKDMLRTRLSGLAEKEAAAYSVQEDWELKERSSKYILNSSHVFTFFGLRCYFPLADSELMSFFRDLPLSLRYHGKLYYDSLYSCYFNKHKLDFSNDIQPSARNIFVNNLKKKIRPFLPMRKKKELLLKNDWAAYDPMTMSLLEELHEQGIYPRETGNSHLYRLLGWYVWKMEGG